MPDPEKKEPTLLEQFKTKLIAKMQARQKILDERYQEVTECLETEEEREERIMNDDRFWQ